MIQHIEEKKCRHGFMIDGRGCAECDLEKNYLDAMDEEFINEK